MSPPTPHTRGSLCCLQKQLQREPESRRTPMQPSVGACSGKTAPTSLRRRHCWRQGDEKSDKEATAVDSLTPRTQGGCHRPSYSLQQDERQVPEPHPAHWCFRPARGRLLPACSVKPASQLPPQVQAALCLHHHHCCSPRSWQGACVRREHPSQPSWASERCRQNRPWRRCEARCSQQPAQGCACVTAAHGQSIRLPVPKFAEVASLGQLGQDLQVSLTGGHRQDGQSSPQAFHGLLHGLWLAALEI